MKKRICLLLTAVMLLSLCACGGKAPEPQPAQKPAQEPVQEAAEWTRQGYYMVENGNMASVTWMDGVDEPGWYVDFMNGEDFSAEAEISVEFAKSAEYIAVFAFPPEVYFYPDDIIGYAAAQGANSPDNPEKFADQYLHGNITEEKMLEGGYIVLWDQDLETLITDESFLKAFNLHAEYNSDMECAAVYRTGGTDGDNKWSIMTCSINFREADAAAAFYRGL